MLPELKAKATLTEKRLTIHYLGKDKHFNLDDEGCINLIEIDDWMTSVINNLEENKEFQKSLRDKYEQEQLRKRLSGEA